MYQVAVTFMVLVARMATLPAAMRRVAWPSSLLTWVCVYSYLHVLEMITPLDQPLDTLEDLTMEERYVYTCLIAQEKHE